MPVLVWCFELGGGVDAVIEDSCGPGPGKGPMVFSQFRARFVVAAGGDLDEEPRGRTREKTDGLHAV